jgi:glycosyltransferase involved in cell wall biosynthesis
MQTYLFRELVIINNSYKRPGEYRLLEQRDYNLPSRFVREIMVERTDRMTVGDLRNIGVEASVGEWFIAWDDDDWSHPERLEYLMERRQPGLVVVPSSHVRYDVKHNTAFLYENQTEGCAGLALYPRTSRRYPPLNRGEDSLFMLETWQQQFVVLDNRIDAHYYLRLCHDNNLSQRLSIMRKYANPRFHGVWVRDWKQVGYLESFHTEYLKRILREQYDLKIDGKPWPDDVEAIRRAELDAAAPHYVADEVSKDGPRLSQKDHQKLAKIAGSAVVDEGQRPPAYKQYDKT